MRNILVFIFKISLMLGLLVPVNSSAVPAYLFDLSAGVFRFQIKLAEQGNPEAQYKVGEMYETGTGVNKDLQVAQVWFEKAAKQGHKKAGYKLLYLEIQSNGLNDFTKSQLGVLRQESASGNPNAQYFLGKMYAAGVGVPKSLNNALTWLNKATFNGVSEAEHDAIAVEEELARIREKKAKKQAATALEVSRQRKAEEKRLKAVKRKEAEKKRKIAAARYKSDKNAETKKALEQRRRIEKDRKVVADERVKLRKERQQAAEAERERKAKEAKAAEIAHKAKNDKAVKEKASFESDPCKGRSARFLSTCR